MIGYRLGLAVLILAPSFATAQPVRTIALTGPVIATEEFTRVVSVRELRDRRLLVSDRRDNRVVVLDFDNGTATQLGRRGAGPGEYRNAGLLVPGAGDTTVMFDSGSGRWLLFHGAAAVGTVPADDPRVKFAEMPVGVGPAYVYGYRFPPNGLFVPDPDSVALVRVSRTSGKVDTIARLVGPGVKLRSRVENDRISVTRLSVSSWSAGDQALLFPDGWIGIARVDPYRVDWLSPANELRPGRSLPDGAIPFTQAERVAHMARSARGTGRAAQPPESRDDWPDDIPPFTSASPVLGEPSPALIAVPDGNLIIRRTPTAAQPNQRYDVIDRRGTVVARIILAATERLAGVGAGYAYTVQTDDDGIQRIRRYVWPR